MYSVCLRFVKIVFNKNEVFEKVDMFITSIC